MRSLIKFNAVATLHIRSSVMVLLTFCYYSFVRCASFVSCRSFVLFVFCSCLFVAAFYRLSAFACPTHWLNQWPMRSCCFWLPQFSSQTLRLQFSSRWNFEHCGSYFPNCMKQVLSSRLTSQLVSSRLVVNGAVVVAYWSLFYWRECWNISN